MPLHVVRSTLPAITSPQPLTRIPDSHHQILLCIDSVYIRMDVHFRLLPRSKCRDIRDIDFPVTPSLAKAAAVSSDEVIEALTIKHSRGLVESRADGTTVCRRNAVQIVRGELLNRHTVVIGHRVIYNVSCLVRSELIDKNGEITRAVFVKHISSLRYDRVRSSW